MFGAILVTKGEGRSLAQLTGGRILMGGRDFQIPSLVCHLPGLHWFLKAHRAPHFSHCTETLPTSLPSRPCPGPTTHRGASLLFFILALGNFVLWAGPWAVSQRQLRHRHCPWASEPPYGVCRLSHLILEGRMQTTPRSYIICPTSHSK